MAFGELTIRTKIGFSFASVFLLGAATIFLAASSATPAPLLAMGLLFFAACVASAVWLSSSTVAPLAEAVLIVETVKSGDLSQEFETNRGGEFGRLLRGLGDMEDRLTDVVSEIKTTSDALMQATHQLGAGHQDLSSRSEEQARSLRLTAETMVDLTARVKRNADGAREAQQLAASTSTQAAKGGGDVADLRQTMQAIKDSSGRIADITEVIDAIAFQTNILALNAAVEAARAGENGRGFAVVAAEVRSLAQRSATAAKEIKTLIDGSASQVEDGAQRAMTAEQTIKEIVTSTRQVSEIIAEISAASAEQTSEIEAINRSVAEMDAVTQQNAALVEQATAATQVLQTQAQSLATVVDSFKLE
jgi:methyl-accepting chemotaxis protein